MREEEEKKKEQEREKEEKAYNKLSQEEKKAKDKERADKEKAEKEDKKYLDADDYCEENPEDFVIMFVLKKDPKSQDKIKSVQYTRQTGAIEVYYFDPLSPEDDEDDGIFIGRITD
jgi:ATPase subunit of ABC transporter with duplicated ATPase domains